MTRKPAFDASALASALDSGRAPATYDRAGRIKLLGEAAQELIALRSEAGLFVGGALLAYLENGGDLARDYLKIIVNGSHQTPARVWKTLKAAPFKGRRDTEGADTVASSLVPESEREK